MGGCGHISPRTHLSSSLTNLIPHPMKTLLSLLIALAATASLPVAPAQAQTFPNSGFDTWALRNNVESPTNWLTTDDFLGGVFPTGSVTKTSVARTGPFAAQLQTQSLLGTGQLPGIVILGTRLSGVSGAFIPGGLPFTARPRNLQLYYQLSGARALGDSAALVVLLTRRVNGTPTIVAAANFDFQALAATYTAVTLPLQYASGLAPDSVSVIALSGTSNRLTVGTMLRLDDLAFTGTATATRDAALNAAFTAAPNPSPDGRFQLQGLAPALLAAPLTVLDATGRVVRREPAAPAAAARTLDLSALPPGVYTVLLFTADGLVTRKLAR